MCYRTDAIYRCLIGISFVQQYAYYCFKLCIVVSDAMLDGKFKLGTLGGVLDIVATS